MFFIPETFPDYFQHIICATKCDSKISHVTENVTSQIECKLSSVFHINVQCLSTKLPMLETILSELNNPDILCICEHWMNLIQSSVTIIKNYKNISTFCRTTHIHGGVAIFCRTNLADNCKILCTKRYCIELDFEVVAVMYNEHSCIANIYRSPKGDINNFLLHLSLFLADFNNKFRHIILTGDFNIDKLSDNRQNKSLSEIIESFSLISLVNEPTRIDLREGFNSSTALDYVITNLVDCKIILVDAHISDHKGQLFIYNLKENYHHTDPVLDNKRICRNFSEQNMFHFANLFYNEFDLFTKEHNNIDDYFCEFLEHFQWCLDMSCKKKIMSVKNNKSRNDPRIRQEVNNLKYLYCIAKNSGCPELMRSFKNCKKCINNKISNIRIGINTDMIENSMNKNKTLWQIVNNRLGRQKEKTKTGLKINSEIIHDKKQICEIFANYFSTCVKDKLDNHFGKNISNICTTSRNIIKTTFFFEPVTGDEVMNIIDNMKNKNSTGVDEIPIRLLKFSKYVIADSLAHLINLSINLGEFPNVLKLGKVIPLHKKEDPHLVQNHRPITLLSYLSKISEKAVANRIYLYLESNNLFTNSQFGYRENKSTELATIEFVQKIYHYLDKGKKVASLFFDLTAAFDSVNPKFLEVKLKAMGINGNILKWLISYLENRKIFVSMNSETSNIVNMDIGVAQGSIIGPLLFLIFINDLPDYIIDGEVLIYADDTSVIIHSDTVEHLENKTISVIKQFEDWCNRNALIINKKKTVFLYFSNVVSKNVPKIGYVETSKKTTFLGSVIDSTLTFTPQIDTLCCKLAKTTFAILNLKKELNTNVLVTCYYSLAYSVISYNIILWGQSTDATRVFVMQKRIIRILFDLNYRESCRDTFKTKKIMTVICIYIFKISCFIHRNLHEFKTNRDFHNYPTRSVREIHINSFNLSKYRKSPHCAGSYIYNKLPLEIRSQNSFRLFRNKLKTFLIGHCFYNMTEFFDC